MSMRGETRRKAGPAGTGGPRGGERRRRQPGNVFKFMAAFKTPSASGRGLQRATARAGRGGRLVGPRGRGSEGARGQRERARGSGGGQGGQRGERKREGGDSA